VRAFERAIAPFGYDATFTYLDGRNHFDLYDGDVLHRLAAQMFEVARPRHRWTPRAALAWA
jgi:hypothetical protein